MGLLGVLLDRARVIRKTEGGLQYGGRTTFVDNTVGTWFAARLFIDQVTPQTRSGGFVTSQANFAPYLIYDIEDDNLVPVEVRFTDVLEVESEDLGNDMWQVTSEPQPFRKKRGVIAYQVNLSRVEVHEYERDAV